MLRSTLAAGMIAGGLFAFVPATNAAVVSPSGLSSMADRPSNVIEVRRRGGHKGFRGRHFGRKFHSGRHFRYRGHGRRHYAYGGHRRHGRRHGVSRFLYGALPFVGYGAYSYGYRSNCGWLWSRYQHTGSRYWYRRWKSCRYYW